MEWSLDVLFMSLMLLYVVISMQSLLALARDQLLHNNIRPYCIRLWEHVTREHVKYGHVTYGWHVRDCDVLTGIKPAVNIGIHMTFASMLICKRLLEIILMSENCQAIYLISCCCVSIVLVRWPKGCWFEDHWTLHQGVITCWVLCHDMDGTLKNPHAITYMPL